MGTINYKNAKGERISGVTTIISQNLGWNKQPLMYWANQMGLDGKNHREVAEKAADAGTIAHNMIECEIQGRPIKELDGFKGLTEQYNKAETCFSNFLDWQKQVHFDVIKTEVHLVSDIFNFGGTPDCIVDINGYRSLFDWKTSNGVYPDMLIQLSAYKQLWEENHGQINGGFYLLRIVKEDASWHYHHWEDLSDAWEVFKHLLAIHKMQKILKKKL